LFSGHELFEMIHEFEKKAPGPEHGHQAADAGKKLSGGKPQTFGKA
jgi:hypothetical protein